MKTKFKKLFLCSFLFIALLASASGQNTVSFYNQSGQLALVKLIGPTSQQVTVANGTRQSVETEVGSYYIKVRYGTPNNYSYSEGENFEVTETVTEYSETTITLHKVVDGNYGSHPIKESDF